jgi:hypothetical protein
VRFLGQFDNVFLSHAERGRIMGAVKWDASFAHRGAVLVDGFIAGAWKLGGNRTEATLEVEIRSGREPRVREEAEALLAFLRPEARTRRIVLV